MNLTECGSCGPRNIHCWRAILEAVEQWSPNAPDAVLEAYFDDDAMRLLLIEPDAEPITASVDISWISYKDQAERLGLLTKMALVDIDLERLSRRSERNGSLQKA